MLRKALRGIRPVLRKALHAMPAVLVVLGVLAAGAYALHALLFSGDDTGVARPLLVSVLAPNASSFVRRGRDALKRREVRGRAAAAARHQ